MTAIIEIFSFLSVCLFIYLEACLCCENIYNNIVRAFTLTLDRRHLAETNKTKTSKSPCA